MPRGPSLQVWKKVSTGPQLDVVLRSDFKLAKEREISNGLANLVTEKAVRTAGLKSMRMRQCFTVEDDGTASARIVLLGYQDHRLGTIATASRTTSVRGRILVLQVCANLGLMLNKSVGGP